ncbi:MAG: Crp/Fnr family transcriptional regulator [Eubacterium sp.]|nr:Crp/Fnr family transcriptional regulator [Eubacterium sp.]
MAENNQSNPSMVQFPEGAVILREGEVNLDMYKIVSGKAELYISYGTEEEVLIGIIKEGACFGEFGLLLKEPAIYTVVAYSDILAVRITEGAMGDFIQENHGYVLGIMQNMARSMMRMKYHIDLLTRDLEEGKGIPEADLKEAQSLMKNYSLCNPVCTWTAEV